MTPATSAKSAEADAASVAAPEVADGVTVVTVVGTASDCTVVVKFVLFMVGSFAKAVVSPVLMAAARDAVVSVGEPPVEADTIAVLAVVTFDASEDDTSKSPEAVTAASMRRWREARIPVQAIVMPVVTPASPAVDLQFASVEKVEPATRGPQHPSWSAVVMAVLAVSFCEVVMVVGRSIVKATAVVCLVVDPAGAAVVSTLVVVLLGTVVVEVVVGSKQKSVAVAFTPR
mmetsp:Transcript_4939/g.12360  ORF Transcript_4939/g.12360 Transcript_4939/m.12360 type:complete len:230 (+) Transcript_4939:1130-1819(+)